MNCPIGLDEAHCANCGFVKERQCDYPYWAEATMDGIARIREWLRTNRQSNLIASYVVTWVTISY